MSEPTSAVPHVYIASGNDPVSKEAFKSAAVRSIESAARCTLMRETYDPTDGPFDDFMQNVLTPTLFGDLRFFTLSHAETLSEADLGELDRLLGALPDDVYLFVDIGESAKRKTAKSDPVKKLRAAQRSKEAPERFACRDFQKPPEYKVAQWLLDNAPDLCGRSIEKEAADLLVDLAGYDTAALMSEVGKIDLLLEKGRKIDRAAVEEVVGASRPMTVFELADACGRRDGPRTLQVIGSLFTTACSVPMIISVLFRHYSALYRIRCYARANPADVKLLTRGGGSYQAKNDAAFRIGCAAGLLHEGEERKVFPVIIQPDIVGRAQRFSDRELETIFGWLLDFDVAIKTGAVAPDREEVELFCYKLLRVSQLCSAGGVS
jgi:DNA polymerase-3 subunit delta